jgi:hypothetical protein
MPTKAAGPRHASSKAVRAIASRSSAGRDYCSAGASVSKDPPSAHGDQPTRQRNNCRSVLCRWNERSRGPLVPDGLAFSGQHEADDPDDHRHLGFAIARRRSPHAWHHSLRLRNPDRCGALNASALHLGCAVGDQRQLDAQLRPLREAPGDRPRVADAVAPGI